MGLRQQLDAIEPHFKPGGRFESWYALYEAVDTIFYSPGSVTRANAHVACTSLFITTIIRRRQGRTRSSGPSNHPY